MTITPTLPKNSGPSSQSDETQASIPPILRLPPELFDHLLHHVNPEDLQSTALALSRVFPDHPISKRHLWRHVVARSKGQMIPMWRKMRDMTGKGKDGGPEATRTFSMETWKGDADILNNVLRCLPDLRVLMLNVGTNFSPEHLVEMFEEPRLGIKRMEMRFRPYVEQATYYQFLAGAYFDTAIETLYRRWPAVASFTHLSIVQDLPPRVSAPPTVVHSVATTAANSQITSLNNSMTDLTLNRDETPPQQESTPPTSADESVIKGYTGHGPFPYLADKMAYAKPKTFAQPIVFFDIKCLARFGASPVASNLTHLRLRVPTRDIAFVLVGPGGTGGLFPSLRYLDISTTNLRLDAVFTTLLKVYVNLEHLVLDHVNLFGFMSKDRGDEMCKELGGMIVSAGLARGKDRERRIAAWEVGQRTRLAHAEAERRSAIGLSSSTLTQEGEESEEEEDTPQSAEDIEAAARAAERERQIAIARSRRGHRSAGHSTFSLRDRPVRAGRSSATTLEPSIPLPPQDILYLVLPPLPTLQTICIGGEAHGVSSKKLPEWDDEFNIGWREGLSKVLGWAGHVADRYERALRKAEEWRIQEIQGVPQSSSAKGKSKGGPAPVKTRPPLDIRLLRFPYRHEVASAHDQRDPTSGLIEVEPITPRDYMTPYHDAISEAESYANDRSKTPPCVMCTVPDCEGPARRGAEPGERVDGRGGMGGSHRPGCGHAHGRARWGWEGVEP